MVKRNETKRNGTGTRPKFKVPFAHTHSYPRAPDWEKFAWVQTDIEDELQLFLSARQRKKLRGAGARRKVTFSSAMHRKAAKIVSVISSGSSSESVCAGCRGGCNRDASSPSDNVIRVRKEQHLHYNVVTGSHLARWMFTTTPIFHAPDVSPLTLLRLKFQKKLGPNYCLNNDYFLSGPLGLTSIFFVFVAVKVIMDGFVHLAFSVTELVQCYCGVPLNHWRKTACK